MFRDACVRHLDEWQALEESTRIPEAIFPVYLGSGTHVLSVDASGLQGLNHGVQRAFNCMPDAGDLYWVRHGRMGHAVSEDNVLPLGFLDWTLEKADGSIIGPESLVERASLFRRRFSVRDGRLETRMLLDLDAELTLRLLLPHGTGRILASVECRGYDYSHRPILEERTGRFALRLHLVSRQGKPLYDHLMLHGQTLSTRVAGWEDYHDRITIGTDCPDAIVTLENGTLSVSIPVRFGQEWQGSLLVLDARDPLPERLPADFAEVEETRNREAWASYWERVTGIEGLDPREAFLYRQSHYLVHGCLDLDQGLPIGLPFYFPWCWRGSTFWDSHFVLDGLMRCGDRTAGDRFLRFLRRHLRPTGKPYPWMFGYDGRSTVPDERDMAPLVMCAHAMTAIKHYEYFQDPDALRDDILPILDRVSSFAVERLFRQDPDGRWILAEPVSNDVVDERPEEVNQTFTLLWFLVIFRKTLDLSEIAHRSPSHADRLADILANHRIEQDDQEYFHARGVRARDHAGASWVPFLLYPTEAVPFVDMARFHRTRDLYTFPQLYMEKQGSYQPWTEFMEAQSDFRRDRREDALLLRRQGLDHAFGLGYFSEIGPRQQTCGLPPYISAHGTFLSSLLFQFVSTSIWEDRIGLFDQLPSLYVSRRIAVSGIVARGGAIIDAERTPDLCQARIVCSRPMDPIILIALPERVDLRDAVLRLRMGDGPAEEVSFEPSPDRTDCIRIRVSVQARQPLRLVLSSREVPAP